MKIEIGESLFYSWLRHIKNCRIVQTNWKTSSSWKIYHEEELEKLYNAALIEFSDCLIKKDKLPLGQFLKQAEIDVIGKSENNEFYVIDVAFHKNTCNYSGNGNSNEKNITKKLIRAAFCLYGYFDTKKGYIIFATPKFGKTSLDRTKQCITKVKEFFSDNGFKFNVECICNEDFNSKIVIPVTEKCNDNSDTAELFMRAYDLCTLTSNVKRKSKNSPTEPKISKIKSPFIKIGQIVKNYLIPTLLSDKISSTEVQKLQDADYSKQTFDINYPLLSKERIINGHARYYVSPLLIKGVKYYVCQEWFDRNYQKLETWLKAHNVTIKD
ncbi:MAG: hypothetical protein MR368_03460 [Azospirillum sp.]|nr:hypothetical protein [Azospirillum sp.]